MDLRLIITMCAGESLQRPQSSITRTKRHQNSCKTIEQACNRNPGYRNDNCVASFDGNRHDQSTCVTIITACGGGFYVWKHLQDYI